MPRAHLTTVKSESRGVRPKCAYFFKALPLIPQASIKAENHCVNGKSSLLSLVLLNEWRGQVTIEVGFGCTQQKLSWGLRALGLSAY